jgi:uncharacterized membrane protein YdbT with pleckstrin-like domain
MTSPEEEIVWKGHPSHVFNFWLHLVCWLSCLLIVPVFIFDLAYWLTCVLVVPILLSLWKIFEVRSRGYELTTERLKTSQGIFSRRSDQLELYRVRDITVEQPFMYRMFKKGNVLLTTDDASTPTVLLECVPQPEELRDQLRKCVEICRDRKRTRLAEISGEPGDHVAGLETT